MKLIKIDFKSSLFLFNHEFVIVANFTLSFFYFLFLAGSDHFYLLSTSREFRYRIALRTMPVSNVDRRNGGRRSIRRPGKWSCPANKFGRQKPGIAAQPDKICVRMPCPPAGMLMKIDINLPRRPIPRFSKWRPPIKPSTPRREFRALSRDTSISTKLLAVSTGVRQTKCLSEGFSL